MHNHYNATTHNMKTSFSKAMTVLSALGIAVTSYLIHQHYAPVDSSFCNFNDYVSCDIVNKSEFSTIFGVPVSIFGLLTYIYLFVFSLASMRNKAWAKKLFLPTVAFTLFGLLFSFYLTYTEFFVLFAVCIFCLTQQILILSISSLLLISLWHSKKISN